MTDSAAKNLEDESHLSSVGDDSKVEGVVVDDLSNKNLEMLLDIPLKVSVELGRTRMLVRDLLNLGQGSVVELDKLAGEPMEILVNNKLIARGEAVVVNEKFGVRLIEVISTSERMNQLSND